MKDFCALIILQVKLVEEELEASLIKAGKDQANE